MTTKQLDSLPRRLWRRVRRWLWRFIRALTLRHLTAHALNGMLANPAWMQLAKEECSRPGCGHDVPTFFGQLAARYARDALSEIEEIERTF